MRQTNISLEEWQYQHLKELAAREGKSISQIIRELIDEKLSLREEEIEKDPIFEIIALGKGKGGSVARDHDAVLYRKEG
ncbi:MAG TPA: ribbon-helix-helix protein, CopG family [Candidatus Acetothermia bacterium]|nr:ribbon-helix-helix protein, CopG family [Candidatus Acetothermia bacterium]